MSRPLLEIKTTIPRTRENLIPRPHLLDRIDEGSRGSMILVSAPAGFGKTTLVSSWIERTNRAVAWLSLDESENKIHRFFQYLIAALQRLHVDLGLTIQPALETQSRIQTGGLLTSLLNEIAALDFPVSLVFDDYHLIDSENIHNALEFLVHHAPANTNVIVISRVDPPIPLSRLRASGELTEIRSSDLRFNAQEVHTFLNVLMNLGLSRGDTNALRVRTEGWIAGLQLAALSLRERDDKHDFIEKFSGSHQYIIDYLLEEVLEGLPEETKRFLYQISILDQFCAPLCDAVVGIRDSHRIIQELEDANLFLIPLDENQRWYRFHHLFVDFLRHASNFDSEARKDMHRKASEWFERRGELIPAIDHRVEAGDFLDAASIIDRVGVQLLEDSKLSTLIGLIRSIPEQHACMHPWVCIYHAWALRLTGGGYEDVEHLLDCAEKSAGLTRTDSVDRTDHAASEMAVDLKRMRGHTAAIRAYQALYREDIPSVLRLANEALQHRPEGNFIRSSIALAQGWAYRFSGDLEAASVSLEEARSVGRSSGNTYLSVTATSRLAYSNVLRGRLHHAADLCQDAVRLATLRGNSQLPVAGYAQIYLGMIHFAWNELDEARHRLLEGIENCRQVGYVVDQIVGSVLLARVYQAVGEHEAAGESLDQADRLSRGMQGYLYAQRWVEDGKVRFWAAKGDLRKLSSWIQNCGMSLRDPPSFLREMEQLILARAQFHLLREDPGNPGFADLLAFMERIRAAVHDAGWSTKEVEILLLQSMAFSLKGERDHAMAAFESALLLSETERHLRPFLDEGKLIQEQLLWSVRHGLAPKFCQEITRALDGLQANAHQVTSDKANQALIEPLSRRELEVLELLAGDLSGPEIASQLVIAVSTLRYHTHQIYTKLGVHSRREAVSRAEMLGLI